MKLSIPSVIAIVLFGAVSASAIADDRPAPKGPPKTMGDEGKLPASNTMRNAVPDMTGPAVGDGSAGAGSGTGGSVSTKGPPVRMGDEEGKLPATGTVSDAIPEMRGPSSEE